MCMENHAYACINIDLLIIDNTYHLQAGKGKYSYKDI